MRLSTRTGLAAFVAAFLSLAAIGLVFHGLFGRILLSRVDHQLESRAQTAPILAAIADRLSASELSGTVQGARVARDGRTVDLGRLPADALPPVTGPGWATASADGEQWRLYTIAVVDVPREGDRSLVQLVAPLGDAEAASRRLRRRSLLVGLVAAVGAGAVGYLLGALATRPLTLLRRDAARLDDATPERWRVAAAYGSIEVDEVAGTLNHSLSRLAEETQRRGAALESARAFASAATHELRAPLQSALTNLNLATSGQLPPGEQEAALVQASAAVERTASALAAVRTLAEAELADPAWFAPADLAELVEAAVAGETSRADVDLRVLGPDGGDGPDGGNGVGGVGGGPDPAAPGTLGALALWGDGVQLAVANVVRNAVRHGRPADPAVRPRIVVRVEGAAVVVDDNGPGIPPADRARVLERFERGSRTSAAGAGASGSGLGLTIARQVALAHGGSVTITDSPLGGCRVTLRFAPTPAPAGSPPPAPPPAGPAAPVTPPPPATARTA